MVEESYQIGLVQYQEQTTLNALREAFMSRLEEWGCDETQVEIEYQTPGATRQRPRRSARALWRIRWT